MWSWPTDSFRQGLVSDVQLTPGATPCVRVTTHDGVTAAHSRTDAGWRIDLDDHGAHRSVSLAGFRREKMTAKPERVIPLVSPRAEYVLGLSDEVGSTPPGSPIRGATVIPLGESHYVRTEQSWEEAGEPTATVQIAATSRGLVVDVHAYTGPLITDVPDEFGRLDNEHPDVNADGVQWYMAPADVPHPSRDWHSAALHVPSGADAGSSEERRTRITGHDFSPRVASILTVDGWAMRLRWPWHLLPLDADGAILFELVVNERPAGRERRRGQLVLSGGGGFGYLMGWRRPTNRFVRLVLPYNGIETTLR